MHNAYCEQHNWVGKGCKSAGRPKKTSAGKRGLKLHKPGLSCLSKRDSNTPKRKERWWVEIQQDSGLTRKRGFQGGGPPDRRKFCGPALTTIMDPMSRRGGKHRPRLGLYARETLGKKRTKNRKRRDAKKEELKKGQKSSSAL